MKQVIMPACNAAGFGVQTAEVEGSDIIHYMIIQRMDETDLVIAELADHNPNVLFELGTRIAKEKPILLIWAQGTDRIFNMDYLLHVFDYRPNIWPSTVEADVAELTKRINGV